VFLPVVILFCLDQQLCVPSSCDLVLSSQSCWSRQKQDHNWKEQKVIGQDRKRSQLEGTQSGWSRQNKITTGRNTTLLVKKETRSQLEGTNNFVFLPVVILFCLDQQLCVPSSGDVVLS
jgi:hypothetical protein